MEFEIINDVLINSTDKNVFDKGSKYYEDGYVQKIKYTNERINPMIVPIISPANFIPIKLNNKNITNFINLLINSCDKK